MAQADERGVIVELKVQVMLWNLADAKAMDIPLANPVYEIPIPESDSDPVWNDIRRLIRSESVAETLYVLEKLGIES